MASDGSTVGVGSSGVSAPLKHVSSEDLGRAIGGLLKNFPVETLGLIKQPNESDWSEFEGESSDRFHMIHKTKGLRETSGLPEEGISEPEDLKSACGAIVRGRSSTKGCTQTAKESGEPLGKARLRGTSIRSENIRTKRDARSKSGGVKILPKSKVAEQGSSSTCLPIASRSCPAAADSRRSSPKCHTPNGFSDAASPHADITAPAHIGRADSLGAVPGASGRNGGDARFEDVRPAADASSFETSKGAGVTMENGQASCRKREVVEVDVGATTTDG